MPEHNRPFLALGLRLLAAFALATLYMLVKYVNAQGVALPEIMFWRQAVSLPLLLGWVFATGQTAQLRSQRRKAHAMRSVMGTIGMVTLFGAQILLPLAVATVLGFTTPLFAVILTALVLKDRVGLWRWAAVVLGFAGVLVIAQPGSAGAMHLPPLGAAAGLLTGLLVAIISLQIRDLTRTETPLSVVFYFALFSTMILAPLLPFFATAHSAQVWGIILVLGVIGTAAQMLLTAALRYGAAASVLVMDYTTLVWTTLYGWLVFDQLPPSHTWLGAPLIVAAGLVIAWREHIKLRRLQAVEQTPPA
ncbi:DMT family transporter [Novosphingobium umbonatum]|nr:DMT family transporter [Novosphingobium umbonatum]